MTSANYVTELAEVTYILAEALEEIGNNDEVRVEMNVVVVVSLCRLAVLTMHSFVAFTT